MTKTARSSLSWLALLIASAAAAWVGFAEGRSSVSARMERSVEAGRPHPSGVPPVAATESVIREAIADEPPELPEASFVDQAGMDEFIAGLRSQGISEDLAKWLAISGRMRTDLPASLELAVAADVGMEWAVAVALQDPEGGFELVRGMKGPVSFSASGMNGPLTPFFQTLARTNPKLGLSLLERLSVIEAGPAANAFFESWASVSPDGAINATTELGSKSLREHAQMGLFKEWGSRDRREMIAWASAQDQKTMERAFRSLYDAGGVSDPEGLLNLVQEFSTGGDFLPVSRIATELATKGADGWGPISELPPGRIRNTAIWSFSSRMSEANPEAFWQLAQTVSEADRKRLLGGFATRQLAKIAPAEIAAIARDGNEHSHVGVAEIVSIWAGSDSAAAFDWSVTNLAGAEQTEALEGALRGWVKTDPSGAVEVLNGLEPGKRARLLPDVLSSWGASDPQAALKFADDLAPAERARATEGVVKGWAYTDAAAAAAALVDLPPQGLGSAYDTVAWRLADSAPGEAMGWAESIADDGMRNRVVGKVTESWAEKDAAGASESIGNLEPGPFRDRAVEGLVRAISGLDPASAQVWAKSIGSEDLREKMLKLATEGGED